MKNELESFKEILQLKRYSKQTIDSYLSNLKLAQVFLRTRIVNIDKSGANSSAILTVNKRSLSTKKIKIRKVKYLNNILEQDHRRIKRRIRIMIGFKEFESAQRTLK